MFKIIVAITLLVAATTAFPQQPGPDAQATLLSSTFGDDGAGNVNYAFESSNGIKQEASGQLKDVTIADQQGNQQPGKVVVLRGTYTYTSPDGAPITLEWIADENGFQPKGAHLPV